MNEVICKAHIYQERSGGVKTFLYVILISYILSVFCIILEFVGIIIPSGKVLYILWSRFSVITIVPAIICYIVLIIAPKFTAKQCQLELHKNEIVGVLATPFSQETLKLPIEKVDIILVKNSIICNLKGGPMLIICSTSGKIKVNLVQNPNEFASKTLEAINKNKLSLTAKTSEFSTSNENNIEKITKLKDLLDQGIITKEEFDKKKTELLESI